MTKQDVLDRVFEWFVAEGNPPSMRKGTSQCLLHGANGERCAVGLFLTDYKEVFECDTVDVLLPYLPKLDGERHKKSSLDFWKRLQEVHDAAAHNFLQLDKNFLDEFVPRLRTFSKRRKLIYPGDQR